jgi:hypothetical protein
LTKTTWNTNFTLICQTDIASESLTLTQKTSSAFGDLQTLKLPRENLTLLFWWIPMDNISPIVKFAEYMEKKISELTIVTEANATHGHYCETTEERLATYHEINETLRNFMRHG